MSGIDNESQRGARLPSVQTHMGQGSGVEFKFVDWRGLVISYTANLICFFMGQHRTAPFMQTRCPCENGSFQQKLCCCQDPFGNPKGVTFSCQNWGLIWHLWDRMTGICNARESCIRCEFSYVPGTLRYCPGHSCVGEKPVLKYLSLERTFMLYLITTYFVPF